MPTLTALLLTESRYFYRGKVPPPEVASQLYDVIEAAEAMDESAIPQQSYIPPAPGQPLFDANRAN